MKLHKYKALFILEQGKLLTTIESNKDLTDVEIRAKAEKQLSKNVSLFGDYTFRIIKEY